jgi:hypothetical protein
VVHRQNLDRLPDLIELALTLGAGRLEVAHVQYYGWALRNRAALLPTRAQLDAATDTVNRARDELKGRLVIDYVVPDYYATLPKACMGGWGRQFLAVSPTGLGAALPRRGKPARLHLPGPADHVAPRRLEQLRSLQPLPRHRLDARALPRLRAEGAGLGRLPLPSLRPHRRTPRTPTRPAPCRRTTPCSTSRCAKRPRPRPTSPTARWAAPPPRRRADRTVALLRRPPLRAARPRRGVAGRRCARGTAHANRPRRLRLARRPRGRLAHQWQRHRQRRLHRRRRLGRRGGPRRQPRARATAPPCGGGCHAAADPASGAHPRPPRPRHGRRRLHRPPPGGDRPRPPARSPGAAA